MSHGGGGSDIKAEPNLTPLLDLVLQLVMFFIVVANFSVTQASQDIALPKASSARPVTKEPDVRYLNIRPTNDERSDLKAEVLVLGRRPMTMLLEVEDNLKQEAQLIRKKLKDEGKGEDVPIPTIIIIRADKRIDYKPVYEIMQTCKKAGFRKLQLNAMKD
jgi:biopolymer transport protein ExbD